jgi:TolB-like protein
MIRPLAHPGCQPAGARHRVRLLALLLLSSCVPATGRAQAAPAALPAVVVWDFENQSAMTTPESNSGFLVRSLSENVTASLLQVTGLPVVERQRLKDLLAEQKLSGAALADEDSRLRLGRIIGAERMVFGGYFVLGDEVQVHLRLVDTATSRVIFSDETSAPMNAVMQQMEPLNRRLARALGGQAGGGRSFRAELWQAYDRALALADAGQLDDAVQALQRLLAQDKDFSPAQRELIALLDKLARR